MYDSNMTIILYTLVMLDDSWICRVPWRIVQFHPLKILWILLQDSFWRRWCWSTFGTHTSSFYFGFQILMLIYNGLILSLGNGRCVVIVFLLIIFNSHKTIVSSISIFTFYWNKIALFKMFKSSSWHSTRVAEFPCRTDFWACKNFRDLMFW